MSDWYVSSAGWTAIPQFAASGVYTVGNIVRPLTAPAVTAQYAFRCTTAGTASTEPAWPTANNSTVTTGGATFTNVSGQSTYGWSAAVGNLHTMLASGNPLRVAVGDRCFLSSDHSEAIATNLIWNLNGGTGAFGVSQFISVNRAGSVPPAAADVLSGASVGTGTNLNNFTLDPYCSAYWLGIAFTCGASLTLGSAGVQRHYFKNCSISLTTTGLQRFIQTLCPIGLTLDNTNLQIAYNADVLQIALMDFVWINTPTAVGGAGIPTSLFWNGSAGGGQVTVRGVDLSAVTGSLLHLGGGFGKILLDSCRIAPGLNRSIASGAANSGEDEVELVNCYDGTHFLAERHTPAGDLTTEFSTTLVGGAQDNVGLFSHKMVSSVRSDDFAMPLEGFWLDVNNTLTGSSHTATIEIIGSASLNNNDIWLVLEYQGTVSSSLASFVTSQPTNALATAAAVPSSSATWNSPPATPVTQHLQVTFTPQVAGRVRGQVRLGKPSTTVWVNPQMTIA